MLGIPEKFKSLKFIGPTTWNHIFDELRRGEEHQKSWREHWEERGYGSWQEWREAYAAPLNPEKLEWFLYEIGNPIEILPEFFGVPSKGWIDKAYGGEITKQLKEVIHLPIISENEKVKSIMDNFPKETLLTAVLHDGEIILVEGMHRGAALASWNKNKPFNSMVILALARWNNEEIPVFSSGYKNKMSST